MKKIQIINLEFNSTSKSQPPFYCPFTGVKIVSENPFEELADAQYPDSIAAIWMSNDLANFNVPIYKNSKFLADFDSFEDVENFANCIELIEKANPTGDFLAIQLNYSGLFSDDFGVVYILFNFHQN
jgi:hypothetical protein